jgi:hypothetical protein
MSPERSPLILAAGRS